MNELDPAPLLSIAADRFDTLGWAYTRLDEHQVLRLEFAGKNGQWICYIRAREEERQVIIYSNAPVAVPDERRSAMAEFLTRANYGLALGNFEMDFHDGELHYKTSIDVTGDRLSPALLDQIVHANLLTMDHYLPGITAVIAGVAPAIAVARTEDAG